MIVSTKGRYALRVMVELAQHQGDGYVPLNVIAERQDISEKYLESMGLGVNPKVVHAAQFAKMLGEGKVDARRIAFVLDTTIAEEALQKAADEAAAAEAEAHALLPPRKKKRASSRRTWKASSTCVTPTPSTAWACCAWPTSSVTRPMTPCRPSCCTRT